MRWGVLVVTLGCAALAGCSPGVSSEHEHAASTVDAFRLACVRQEGVAVLETLTEAQRESFLEAPSVLQGCARVAGIEAADDAAIRQQLSAAQSRT